MRAKLVNTDKERAAYKGRKHSGGAYRHGKKKRGGKRR